MTSYEALVALNMAADIGTIRLNKLLDYFGKAENIFGATRQKLAGIYGIAGETAAKIASFKGQDLDRELSSAKKLGLKIITRDDDAYPQNLKNIPDPPIVLYIRGELEEEDKFSIAVVGSRRASFYGLTLAEKFAAELSGRGFSVVSGMARGIDTCAHRGALKAGGRTLAVMGSGFRHIYPPENQKLAQKIAEDGAVISELPLDRKPLAQNFPRRNRVISGLSLGVLVVEAAQNSGALITADFALEQGREVFALPGKIDSGTSFGTNGLIQQGAKLVSCVEDILEEFVLPAAACRKKVTAPEENSGSPASCSQESKLYGLISGQPVQLEELVEKSALDIPRISAILLNLEMQKLIRELPGKQFVRSSA